MMVVALHQLRYADTLFATGDVLEIEDPADVRVPPTLIGAGAVRRMTDGELFEMWDARNKAEVSATSNSKGKADGVRRKPR